MCGGATHTFDLHGARSERRLQHRRGGAGQRGGEQFRRRRRDGGRLVSGALVFEGAKAVDAETADGAQLRQKTDGAREQQPLARRVVRTVIAQRIQHAVLQVVNALRFDKPITICEIFSKRK